MAKRKVAVISLFLCFCLFFTPQMAKAASTTEAKEPIDTGKVCSLTLSFQHEKASFPDQSVKLYRIAFVSKDFQYTLTSPFASSGLSLNGVKTGAEWNVIQSTLESYLLLQGISPDFTAKTNSEGKALFENLSPGLYLAVTDPVVKDGYSFSFSSALISLPGLSEEGLWQYEVSAKVKIDFLPPIEQDEKIELKLLKLWKDGGKKTRPNKIEIAIFRNREPFKTVTLSEDNNWTYSWTAEKDGAKWQVAEKNVPSGYTATVSVKENAFVLTNTHKSLRPGAPQTGDTQNLLLYIILMIFFGSMMILLALKGKRKGKK